MTNNYFTVDEGSIKDGSYAFYKFPKYLISDNRYSGMSSDAKLLYTMLLDRMSLSISNGWADKFGRAYVYYTVDNICNDLHCATQKAVKLLDELEKDFGLIERRRQGLGKPNMLFLKKVS